MDLIKILFAGAVAALVWLLYLMYGVPPVSNTDSFTNLFGTEELLMCCFVTIGASMYINS